MCRTRLAIFIALANIISNACDNENIFTSAPTTAPNGRSNSVSVTAQACLTRILPLVFAKNFAQLDRNCTLSSSASIGCNTTLRYRILLISITAFSSFALLIVENCSNSAMNLSLIDENRIVDISPASCV
ncbi:hypothetical protein AX774_g7499 [Zancudomyces culisetae]|uniref:Uncharacterized protein n=1 Tax=Zancudomyces culisetae TaxID=1213189 RepID=A0A1R1PDW3_ZANCU|nr:hypothetical protein AX774_g7499 [Zancudomyces culisetae]|eukprot:OMH79093.1 hypothetical protein AX774_g7499 [Zancudomyces culisetae]